MNILPFHCQVVVLNATYQNEDNIDQYDTDKGGNGRTVVRANFPDRLVDLCPEIEEHEHNSGVKMAGTVYFPVVVSILVYKLSQSHVLPSGPP